MSYKGMIMDMRKYRVHLSSEHKALIKDLTSMMIGYTPAAGIVDTIKFGNKWFGKRKVAHRTIQYIKDRNRKNSIKKRGRKIKNAYRDLGRRYHLDAGTPTHTIAKMKELNT
jgi:hypothetical protein